MIRGLSHNWFIKCTQIDNYGVIFAHFRPKCRTKHYRCYNLWEYASKVLKFSLKISNLIFCINGKVINLPNSHCCDLENDVKVKLLIWYKGLEKDNHLVYLIGNCCQNSLDNKYFLFLLENIGKVNFAL